ncbi:hypothetical protein H072_11482 [Dactylellina haptotyla CBS 200.50]|uniref:Uncharacterized protein n=1 Tax=Dactylellina haptotyla (strain CBS 200.50) TaxID=1284197 RepID=S7ZWX2_DACHA|nr:hypothetical protein H072_11482 [Dactylellina haptotyla CBS 200.50]
MDRAFAVQIYESDGKTYARPPPWDSPEQFALPSPVVPPIKPILAAPIQQEASPPLIKSPSVQNGDVTNDPNPHPSDVTTYNGPPISHHGNGELPDATPSLQTHGARQMYTPGTAWVNTDSHIWPEVSVGYMTLSPQAAAQRALMMAEQDRLLQQPAHSPTASADPQMHSHNQFIDSQLGSPKGLVEPAKLRFAEVQTPEYYERQKQQRELGVSGLFYASNSRQIVARTASPIIRKPRGKPPSFAGVKKNSGTKRAGSRPRNAAALESAVIQELDSALLEGTQSPNRGHNGVMASEQGESEMFIEDTGNRLQQTQPTLEETVMADDQEIDVSQWLDPALHAASQSGGEVIPDSPSYSFHPSSQTYQSQKSHNSSASSPESFSSNSSIYRLTPQPDNIYFLSPRQMGFQPNSAVSPESQASNGSIHREAPAASPLPFMPHNIQPIVLSPESDTSCSSIYRATPSPGASAANQVLDMVSFTPPSYAGIDGYSINDESIRSCRPGQPSIPPQIPQIPMSHRDIDSSFVYQPLVWYSCAKDILKPHLPPALDADIHDQVLSRRDISLPTDTQVNYVDRYRWTNVMVSVYSITVRYKNVKTADAQGNECMLSPMSGCAVTWGPDIRTGRTSACFPLLKEQDAGCSMLKAVRLALRVMEWKEMGYKQITILTDDMRLWSFVMHKDRFEMIGGEEGELLKCLWKDIVGMEARGVKVTFWKVDEDDVRGVMGLAEQALPPTRLITDGVKILGDYELEVGGEMWKWRRGDGGWENLGKLTTVRHVDMLDTMRMEVDTMESPDKGSSFLSERSGIPVGIIDHAEAPAVEVHKGKAPATDRSPVIKSTSLSDSEIGERQRRGRKVRKLQAPERQEGESSSNSSTLTNVSDSFLERLRQQVGAEILGLGEKEIMNGKSRMGRWTHRRTNGVTNGNGVTNTVNNGGEGKL